MVLHIANGQSYTYSGASMSAISKGEGFWIKGNSNCTIDTNTTNTTDTTSTVSGKIINWDDSEGSVMMKFNSNGSYVEGGIDLPNYERWSCSGNWTVDSTDSTKINITCDGDSEHALLSDGVNSGDTISGEAGIDTYSGTIDTVEDISSLQKVKYTFAAGTSDETWIIYDPSADFSSNCSTGGDGDTAYGSCTQAYNQRITYVDYAGRTSVVFDSSSNKANISSKDNSGSEENMSLSYTVEYTN